MSSLFALLLSLHRDKVYRHVRLLKIQRWPEARSGGLSGYWAVDTVQSARSERFYVAGIGKRAMFMCEDIGVVGGKMSQSPGLWRMGMEWVLVGRGVVGSSFRR